MKTITIYQVVYVRMNSVESVVCMTKSLTKAQNAFLNEVHQKDEEEYLKMLEDFSDSKITNNVVWTNGSYPEDIVNLQLFNWEMVLEY